MRLYHAVVQISNKGWDERPETKVIKASSWPAAASRAAQGALARRRESIVGKKRVRSIRIDLTLVGPVEKSE